MSFRDDQISDSDGKTKDDIKKEIEKLKYDKNWVRFSCLLCFLVKFGLTTRAACQQWIIFLELVLPVEHRQDRNIFVNQDAMRDKTTVFQMIVYIKTDGLL